MTGASAVLLTPAPDDRTGRPCSPGPAPVGAPRFTPFDPPLKPWFLRCDEVLQDVEDAGNGGRPHR